MPFTTEAEIQIFFSLLLHVTLTLQIKYSSDFELGARDTAKLYLGVILFGDHGKCSKMKFFEQYWLLS